MRLRDFHRIRCKIAGLKDNDLQKGVSLGNCQVPKEPLKARFELKIERRLIIRGPRFLYKT